MKYDHVMRSLKAAGTAQNRKVYARHGARQPLFGVSFARLGALRKQIKTDHALAIRLWNSGNTDARTLACMIADPALADSRLLEKWIAGVTYYGLADIFVRDLVRHSALAPKKMETWMGSRHECTARAGWNLLAIAALNSPGLPDGYFESCLSVIEKKIHTSKNRARDAMNGAVIAIGLRNPRLRRQAIAAARRVGRVDVDHGETGCKTPDAEKYIRKAAAHRARRPTT